jgi:hypothetical protein
MPSGDPGLVGTERYRSEPFRLTEEITVRLEPWVPVEDVFPVGEVVVRPAELGPYVERTGAETGSAPVSAREVGAARTAEGRETGLSA